MTELVTIITLGGEQKLPAGDAFKVPFIASRLNHTGVVLVPVKHKDFLNALARGLNPDMYRCKNIRVQHYLFGISPDTAVRVVFVQNGKDIASCELNVGQIKQCIIGDQVSSLPGKADNNYDVYYNLIVGQEIPVKIPSILHALKDDLKILIKCLKGEFAGVDPNEINRQLFEYLGVKLPECEQVEDGQKCADTTCVCTHRFPRWKCCEVLKIYRVASDNADVCYACWPAVFAAKYADTDESDESDVYGTYDESDESE